MDTTDDLRNVDDAYVNRIRGLLDPDPKLHAPPLIAFVWGKRSFTGVLDGLDITYLLFDPDGMPLRAKLAITLKEYRSVAAQIREFRRSSADVEKIFVTRLGDTLESVAAAVYRDPARWRDLALANGIDDPRDLRPGPPPAGAEAAMTAPRPGLWADYYAPEYVVRVDGACSTPPPRATSSRSAWCSTSSSRPCSTLTVNDWDDAHLAFKYSSTTVFDPGRLVTIDLGYASRLERVVSGVVTSLSPNFPQSGSPVLTVGRPGPDAHHGAAAARQGRPQGLQERDRRADRRGDRVAVEHEDRHRPLRPGAPSSSWQKNQNDAAFLMERAKRIDFEFYIALDQSGEETLYFRPRKDGRDAGPITVYSFEWGRNLISFKPRLSTTGQVSSVTVRGWDRKTKKPIVYTARSTDLPSSAAGRAAARPPPTKRPRGIVDARC